MKSDQIKISLSDDEREFLLGLLCQEQQGLEKIEEYDGEYAEQFSLIKSIEEKIDIFF